MVLCDRLVLGDTFVRMIDFPVSEYTVTVDETNELIFFVLCVNGVIYCLSYVFAKVVMFNIHSTYRGLFVQYNEQLHKNILCNWVT